MSKQKVCGKNYAWLICLSAMLVWVCSVGLTSNVFSTTVPYIIRDFGYTNTQTAAINTYRVFAAVITSFFIDKLIGKFGYKGTIVRAIFVQALGYVIFAYAKSYVWFIAGALCMGFTNASAGMATLTMIVSNWFESKRGLALSVLACGSGVSAMFMPKLVTNISEKYSLHYAYLIILAVVVFVGLFAVIILKDSPKMCGGVAYRDLGKENIKTKIYGPGLDKRRSILLCTCMILFGFVANICNVSLASIYREVGFGANTVANLMTVYGVGMIIGKLIYGYIMDKKNNGVAVRSFIVIYIAGAIIVSVGLHQNFAASVISILAIGFGASVTSMGISCTAYDFYAEEGFVRNMRTVSFCNSVGSMFSGLVCGKIADILGTYQLSMTFLAISLVIAFIVLMYLYKSISERK